MRRGGPLQRKTPLRAKSGIKRTAPMSKTAKPKAKKPGRSDPSHLRFIRSLPCTRCKHSAPSEAAHLRYGNGGGVGMKPADRHTVPLCRDCHRKQHNVGEIQFWGGSMDAPNRLAATIYSRTGDYDFGLKEILKF